MLLLRRVLSARSVNALINKKMSIGFCHVPQTIADPFVSPIHLRPSCTAPFANFHSFYVPIFPYQSTTALYSFVTPTIRSQRLIVRFLDTVCVSRMRDANRTSLAATVITTFITVYLITTFIIVVTVASAAAFIIYCVWYVYGMHDHRSRLSGKLNKESAGVKTGKRCFRVIEFKETWFDIWKKGHVDALKANAEFVLYDK